MIAAVAAAATTATTPVRKPSSSTKLNDSFPTAIWDFDVAVYRRVRLTVRDLEDELSASFVGVDGRLCGGHVYQLRAVAKRRLHESRLRKITNALGAVNAPGAACAYDTINALSTLDAPGATNAQRTVTALGAINALEASNGPGTAIIPDATNPPGDTAPDTFYARYVLPD